MPVRGVSGSDYHHLECTSRHRCPGPVKPGELSHEVDQLLAAAVSRGALRRGLRALVIVALERGEPESTPEDLIVALRRGPKQGGALFFYAVSALVLILSVVWFVGVFTLFTWVSGSAESRWYAPAMVLFLILSWASALTLGLGRFLETRRHRYLAYVGVTTLALVGAGVWLLG